MMPMIWVPTPSLVIMIKLLIRRQLPFWRFHTSLPPPTLPRLWQVLHIFFPMVFVLKVTIFPIYHVFVETPSHHAHPHIIFSKTITPSHILHEPTFHEFMLLHILIIICLFMKRRKYALLMSWKWILKTKTNFEPSKRYIFSACLGPPSYCKTSFKGSAL